MTFQFAPALRTETSLLIGIAGASGSGKTFSALRLATGLAGDGKIGFIDTEAGRALHYADKFKFDHGELKPPFTPERYTEAVQSYEEAGFKVIVIDSISHEHEGEGGLLEWAERLGETMKPPKNWIKPKTAHKRMVNKMLQSRAHLIFCMRAEDKIKITKDKDGKMVIIQADQIPPRDRWIPICEKRWMYEMTVSMVMTPDNPGVPIPIKIQDQHRFAFPQGQVVDEEAGRKLAEWAKGKTVPDTIPGMSGNGGEKSPLSLTAVPSSFDSDDDLLTFARKQGENGEATFMTWFRTLLPDQQATVKTIANDIKSRWV